MSIYGKDLAYIHDVGFGEFARQATPGILDLLAQKEITSGLLIDLGCGSGIWAAQAVLAGYRVLGIDISAAMIEIAIRRAPEADFKVDSLFEVPLPDSRAVTAIGESLNYLAEDGRGEDRLRSLFQRVYASLSPGGVFVFDLVEPGEGRGLATRIKEGEDWTVRVEIEEDLESRILVRQITTVRRTDNGDIETRETHRLRLYGLSQVTRELLEIGFETRTLSGYGSMKLPENHAGFIARKPR